MTKNKILSVFMLLFAFFLSITTLATNVMAQSCISTDNITKGETGTCSESCLNLGQTEEYSHMGIYNEEDCGKGIFCCVKVEKPCAGTCIDISHKNYCTGDIKYFGCGESGQQICCLPKDPDPCTFNGEPGICMTADEAKSKCSNANNSFGQGSCSSDYFCCITTSTGTTLPTKSYWNSCANGTGTCTTGVGYVCEGKYDNNFKKDCGVSDEECCVGNVVPNKNMGDESRRPPIDTMPGSGGSGSGGYSMGQGIVIPSGTGLPEPPDGADGPIVIVLVNVLSWIMSVFLILAVISFVITGFQYMIALGGDITKAKNNFYYSILAVAVVGGSMVIIRTIDFLLRANTAGPGSY